VTSDLLDGAQLARSVAKSARFGPARASLLNTAKVLEDRRDEAIDNKLERALDGEFLALMEQHYRPLDLTLLNRELSITVDRERAQFGRRRAVCRARPADRRGLYLARGAKLRTAGPGRPAGTLAPRRAQDGEFACHPEPR
jgi:hypothetical protein